MRKRPPFLLHLIALGFILAGIVSLFAVSQTVQSWNWMRAIELQPHPIYLVFKNSFLLIAFFTSAISLWFRLAWSPLLGGISTILASIWFWVDRVILTQNQLPIKAHLFFIIFTLILLVLVLSSLYLLKPYMKKAPVPKTESQIGESHE